MISIIIPTRNRQELLKKCLWHIKACDTPANEEFEVLVIDNNSTDKTKETVIAAAATYPKIKYIHNTDDSLYSGRQLGQDKSQGDLLAFIDDDSFVQKEWLSEIARINSDSDILLATGPNIPLYETEPPEWLQLLNGYSDAGSWCSFLSLMDFGKGEMILPPGFVWGCNFIVRKKAVIEAGGFHPDGVPLEEIHLRGDGESSLALRIAELSGKIVYRPDLQIHHFVSSARMTLSYMCQRAFAQGISCSFSEIRSNYNCGDPTSKIPPEFKCKKRQDSFSVEDNYRLAQINGAFTAGKSFHKACVKESRELKRYILKVNTPGCFNEKPQIKQFSSKVSQRPPQSKLQLKHHILWIWEHCCQKKKIALFGAGQHTHWLLDIIAAHNATMPAAIIDDNPVKEALHEVPVIQSLSAEASNFDLIILSSDCRQELFRKRIQTIFNTPPPVVDLYSGFPPGPYEKL